MKHLFWLVALLLLTLPSQGQIIGLNKTTADNNLTASSGFNLTASAGEGVNSGATLEFKSGSVFLIDAGTTLTWPANIVPNSALQTSVTIQGNTFNGPSQLLRADANGNSSFLPIISGYATPANTLVVGLGNSHVCGGNLSSPSTQEWFALIQQMQALKGHATFQNWAVGGAVTPPNSVQGGTVGAVVPTTQAATWTGPTNTITLSATNVNVIPNEQVLIQGPPTSGAISYGSLTASVSGTTVTLKPPPGAAFAIPASGAGSGTVSFTGNDFSDQFTNFVQGELSSYSHVVVICGDPINDIAGHSTAQLEGWETALATLITGSNSNVTLIMQTAFPIQVGIGPLNWGPPNEDTRKTVNDWMVSGGLSSPQVLIDDVSTVVSANELYPTPDNTGGDGLHLTATGNMTEAIHVTAFLQSHAAPIPTPGIFPERMQLTQGAEFGPPNAASYGDNLLATLFNFGGVYPASGQIRSAGFGSGWYDTAGQKDLLFTPNTTSNAAGTAYFGNGNNGLLDEFRFYGPTATLGIGNQIQQVAGSMLGATILNDGRNGSVTLTPLPAPPVMTGSLVGSGTGATYGYQCCYTSADGTVLGPLSPIFTITGPTTLNGTNYVAFATTDNAGAYKTNVYRVQATGATGNSATLGKVATLSQIQNSQNDEGASLTGMPTVPTPDQGKMSPFHMVGGSGTPTIAAGVGAGTSPTVSITGNDMYGTVTITTGTIPSASATVATVTFNEPYAVAPTVDGWAPKNANAEVVILTGAEPYPNSESATTFVITSGATALTASTTYAFSYHVN